MAVLEEEVVAPALLDKGKLELAAELIKEHGWIQKGFGDADRGYCVLGAIRVAHGLNPNPDTCDITKESFYPVVKHLATVIGALNANGNPSIMHWNDQAGRTKEEVIAALQAAARI